MRSIGIGLAAALAMFVLAPTAATAAPKKDAIEAMMLAKLREKGKAAAPALIAAAGLRCNLTDARMIGEDKTGLAVYEVSCADNLGYVLESRNQKGVPPTLQSVYTCLHTALPAADGTPNSMACMLAGNLNPAAQLQSYVDKSGRPCSVDRARYVGQTQREAFFEVACKTGTGFILATSWPTDLAAPVQMNTCLIYEEGNTLFCELTEPAAQLAPVDALVAKSGKACTVKNRRHILSTKEGDSYFEVACDNGSGYVVQENVKGDLARVINCAHADFVNGGCTLTDARAGETAQVGLYTKLARKAGFACDVAKYAALPTTGAKEIIELQCSNRADGGIGVFTDSSGQIYDCVRAEVVGYRCAFSKKEAVFPKLSGALRELGKPSCVVSDARSFGRRSDEDFIEVACADGDPGWVIGFPTNSDSAKEVLSCGQASNISESGCRLPTNRRR